jgi:hypothetical protein
MPVMRGRKGRDKVMREFEAHALHSGKGGPIVTDPKQAWAIANRASGMPRKRKMRGRV